jgi:hypothetical protein
MVLSELQLSLIGLGAAGIAGVWAYNKWIERRHRTAAERVFRGTQEDILVDRPAAVAAPRLEPNMASAATAAPPASTDGGVTDEPQDTLIDRHIDCVARMTLAAPVSASVLGEVRRALAERLNRLVRLAASDEAGHWRLLGPRDEGHYRQVRIALQLADRRGAVSDEDLAVFYGEIPELARRLNAVADLPPRAEVLAHARMVDAFCAKVDIQIAIHVVHRDRSQLDGAKLRRLAEAAGMHWYDGLFRRIDDGGSALFTLGNLGSTPFAAADATSLSSHGVTFWLDVPRVAAAAAVFGHMVMVARQVADGLDGELVDDERNPLDDAMLLTIRGKVDEIQRKMAAQGIPGGGIRALRLFT